MEYEIEDERVLFDDSTNPSLESDKPHKRLTSPVSPRADPDPRRRSQKAEFLPDEEGQAA